MNTKQFEKTIKKKEIQELNGAMSYIFMSHIFCLLKGGKIWEMNTSGVQFQMSELVGNMMEDNDKENYLETTFKFNKQELINLFKQNKKQGYWEINETEHEYYDENGKLIDDGEYEWRCIPEGIISKHVVNETKTTYYLDKSKKMLSHEEVKKRKK